MTHQELLSMAQLPAKGDDVGDIWPEPEPPRGLLAAENMSPPRFSIPQGLETSHRRPDSGSLDLVAGGAIASAGEVVAGGVVALVVEVDDGDLESDIVR